MMRIALIFVLVASVLMCTTSAFAAEVQDSPAAQPEPFALRMARQLPPIPAWLGERPPLQTVFVPNGEIVTYGPLDLHIQREPEATVTSTSAVIWTNAQGEDWYRYSADGKLLGVMHPTSDLPGHGGYWQDIYADFSDVDKAFKERGLLVTIEFRRGYRIYKLRGENDETVLAAYDFLGNPVEPADIPEEKPGVDLLASPLDATLLSMVYEAQVAASLTDPNARSPFEGTSEGPYAVDPTPRPPRVMATRGHVTGRTNMGWAMSGNDFVEVRPLADPANPYRDEYKPWDYWIFSQHDKRNPKEVEFQRQQQEAQKQRTYIDKDGKKMQTGETIAYSPYIAYRPAYSETWRRFTLRVDSDGYVIPYMHDRAARWQKRMHPAKWTSMYSDEPPGEDYSLQAGGEMPAEVKAALLAEERRQIPEAFPPGVPQWMQAAPPYGFIPMPNGEYVTEGPLGSWNRDWDISEGNPDEKWGERKSRHGWYRYSADGTLLGSVHDYTWASLYNPQYAAIKAEGEAQGYDVFENGGFVAWYTKRSGTSINDDPGGKIVRKWDYDGTEVPFDTTFYRPGGILRYWTWEDVVRQQQGDLPQYL